MTQEEKILDLPLKAKWYDMQERGEKTEEYREITPYWVKRLVFDGCYGEPCSPEDIEWICSQPNGIENILDVGWAIKPYTHIRFRYGYTKRTFTHKIDCITIGRGKPEWGAPTDRCVFIIKHHKEQQDENTHRH